MTLARELLVLLGLIVLVLAGCVALLWVEREEL